MSYPGKLELEGTIRGSKPSKRRSEDCPEQVNREKGDGGDGGNKRVRVTRMEEKKFKKVVAKQAKSGYYNPDPLLRLIGETNETKVHLDKVEVRALVDSGSQISTVTEKLAKTMGWKIKSLRNNLDIEGTGGVKVKYKGYVEALLEIPQVRNFSEPSLFVVVSDSEYGKQVPVQIGTLHIDIVLEKVTREELTLLGKAWERGAIARPNGNKLEEFMIEQVKGPVKAVEYTVIQPGETKKISGMTQFKGNTKRINLVTEPLREMQEVDEPKWVTIPSYGECKGGSSRVGVAIRNVSKKIVVISKGQHIANVTAANQVPNMLAPKYVKTVEQGTGSELSKERKGKLWEQIDIQGAEGWTVEQKELIKETFKDFHDVFALNPLELGWTSLVQHTIRITDTKPFK